MKVSFLLEIERPRIVVDGFGVEKSKPFVVVGIPAFNEETSIAGVVVGAQKFSDAVIVCDDGSTDLTAEIAERLGADVVRHEVNSGYGAAIRSLFERAREYGADALITLDGDGQHDANEIPSVLKPIVQGVSDVVIGSRFIDTNGTAEMPFYRQIGAKVITKMVNGSSKNGVSDAQSGFRAYNRKAIERLSIVEEGMGASVEILLKASQEDLKICEVPSSCKYNKTRTATSTLHPFTHGVGVIMSLIRLIIKQNPLMALGIPGILCLLSGMAFCAWMLQLYASEHVIVTSIALAALSFLLVGFFMLSTAITLFTISKLSRRVNGAQVKKQKQSRFASQVDEPSMGQGQ